MESRHRKGSIYSPGGGSTPVGGARVAGRASLLTAVGTGPKEKEKGS